MTPSIRWLFFPSPSSDGTVLDTYTQTGQWIWRIANNWWNNIDEGSWSSTGKSAGTYLKLDAGSRISRDNLVFSADDPDQDALQADWEIRVTITPSSGGTITSLRAANAGAGDSIWEWVGDAGDDLTLTTAQIEDGGTFEWDASDTIKIELVDPS